jgi:uncharacterized membrane protein YhaH (DUF805 family)
MEKLKRLTCALITLLLLSDIALAQRQGEPEACAACGTCGVGIGVMVFMVIAVIALNVALLVWVARDAKSRGMDSAVIWMILVALTGVIGLVIYLFSRPQGNLVQCPHCNNRRLQASARCPHCGNL